VMESRDGSAVRSIVLMRPVTCDLDTSTQSGNGHHKAAIGHMHLVLGPYDRYGRYGGTCRLLECLRPRQNTTPRTIHVISALQCHLTSRALPVDWLRWLPMRGRVSAQHETGQASGRARNLTLLRFDYITPCTDILNSL